VSTLVIHTPLSKVLDEGKRSFERTLESGVGDEYAIYQNLYERISTGSCVVLLDKDRRLRAEGSLVKLVQRSRTKNGIQRYDVYIRNLKEVAYAPEALNRCVISVI
jgi:hypothetical protein